MKSAMFFMAFSASIKDGKKYFLALNTVRNGENISVSGIDGSVRIFSVYGYPYNALLIRKQCFRYPYPFRISKILQAIRTVGKHISLGQ